MRVCTLYEGGREVVALVPEDGNPVQLLDAWCAANLKESACPESMLDLIEQGRGMKPLLEKAFEQACSGTLPEIEEPHWCPPLVRPSKVVGVMMNDATEIERAKIKPEGPLFFLKAPSTLLGHGKTVLIRPSYGRTHPSAQLAVIIGRKSKDVSESKALDVVFGYSVMNDVTSLGLATKDTLHLLAGGEELTQAEAGSAQVHFASHARSKNTDTFGPFGPWIVTADEVADPNNLSVKIWMGEEACTEDQTSDFMYSVEEVISKLSRSMTLEPGDVIQMGMPGMGSQAAKGIDFQDRLGPTSIEIEKIGTLTNPIALIVGEL